MIDIIGISKRFGSFKVLDNISFDVVNGEVVGFIGPNGAGKTTTIKICTGVLPPDAGDVTINGYSITRDKRVASRYVGWVPEIPIFEPDAKVLDYFVYLAGYYGISSHEARALGKKLLDEVGLGSATKMKLKSLSLGMKKRFALAVSLINNPDNFLFDEVLSGLDPLGIAFFRDLVKRFKREKKAILFSSHILKEVEDIADRVVFINRGNIVKIMTMDEVRKYIGPVLVVKLKAIDSKVLDIVKRFDENAKVEDVTIYIRSLNIEPPEIVETLVKNGYRVDEVRREEPSLEDVFFRVIGGRG